MAGFNLGDVLVTFKAKSEGFQAALGEVNSAVQGVNKSALSMEKATAASQKFAQGLAVVGSAIALAGGFAIKSAAEFEQNRISFDTMLGSAEKGKAMLRSLSEFARKTPFTLPEVVTGARQLLAYGISAEKIIPTFNALGNIAAGVGKDKLPFLTLAFGQVATKGKLAGQELRQFTEAGVPLLQVLAKNMGKTTQEIQAMSEAGQISFGDVESAIFSMSQEGGKFFNLMERQSHSFSGVMSNIQDQIGRTARSLVGIDEEGNIREGSVFAVAKEGAETLMKFLDENQAKIIQFGNDLGKFLGDNAFSIAGAITGALIPAVYGLTAALIAASLNLAPFIALGVTIGVVAKEAAKLSKETNLLKESADGARGQAQRLTEQINKLAPGPERDRLMKLRAEAQANAAAADLAAQKYSGFGGALTALSEDFVKFVTDLTSSNNALGFVMRTILDFGIAIARIAGAFGLLPDSVAESLEAFKVQVQTQMTAAEQAASQSGQTAANNTLNSYAKIPQEVAGTLAPTEPNVAAALSPAANTARNLGAQASNGFIANLGSIPGRIGQALAGIGGAMGRALQPAVTAAQIQSAAMAGAVQNAANSVQAAVRNIQSGVSQIQGAAGAVPGVVQARAKGGIINYLAGGGIPMFTPRGTDTVPAMLTPGEFVIRREAVQSVGQETLEAINSGRGKIGGGSTYHIHLEGVMASGKSDLREVGEQIIRAVDEGLVARNKTPIMGGA